MPDAVTPNVATSPRKIARLAGGAVMTGGAGGTTDMLMTTAEVPPELVAVMV